MSLPALSAVSAVAASAGTFASVETPAAASLSAVTFAATSSASTTTSATSATTASIPEPTASKCPTHEIPIMNDAACAVPFSKENTQSMVACCNGAEVVSYFNDCALYCVAAGQKIDNLLDCLRGKGVPDQVVFCNAGGYATATDTAPAIPASASASVVGNKGGDNGDDNNTSDDGSATASGNSNGDGDHNAAVKLGMGVSVMGISIGVMVFSALAFGGLAV